MGKLLGGADLMTPGLANGPPFPPGAIEGAVVAVASLENPSVPTLVGVCEINIADLGQVQGAKGHAVRGVQWEGDELWRWSASGLPGQQAPDQLDAWLGDTAEAEQALDELSLEPGNETPSDEGEAEGGVSLGDVDELGPPQLEVEEHEPTTQGKSSNIVSLDMSCEPKLICLTL
jgi:translation initiation factor 2D